jgi:hypothetical protein
MRTRDIRDEACQFAECAHPARYRMTGAPDGAHEGLATVYLTCGKHMHTMQRWGWTVDGKLRKDGR